MNIKSSYNWDIHLRTAFKQYSPIIGDFIKAAIETILTNQKNRPDRLRKCSDVTQAQQTCRLYTDEYAEVFRS